MTLKSKYPYSSDYTILVCRVLWRVEFSGDTWVLKVWDPSGQMAPASKENSV